MYLVAGTLVESSHVAYIVGMMVRNLNLRGKAMLAPLAGVSNRPFRLLAVRAGAAMTFTEMVSAEGIIRERKRTLDMMRFGPDERPLGIQLFGTDPPVMREVAALVTARYRPDMIDLNFGCPVKKVVNKNGGAALLRDPVLARKIIRSVVEGAGETPVSIKIRSGWDDSNPVYLNFGRIAEEEGAAMVTMHARSRSRGYKGRADWSYITELKAALSIPVVGNGDIRTPDDAKQVLEQTGCDAVMIGRAAMGNPLIFQQVNKLLDTGICPEPATIGDLVDIALEHAGLLAEEFGELRGTRMMRTLLGWYVRGFPGAARLRPVLHRVETVDEIRRVFERYFQSADAKIRVPWSSRSVYPLPAENGCRPGQSGIY